MIGDVSTFVFVAMSLAILVGGSGYLAMTVYKDGWEEGTQEMGEMLDRMFDKVWHIDNNYYGDK